MVTMIVLFSFSDVQILDFAPLPHMGSIACMDPKLHVNIFSTVNV